MGKLSDLLGKRGKKEIIPENERHEVTVYNKLWLTRVSNSTGFILNEDTNKVDGILKALNRTDGHCPCGGNGPQFLCPCIIMRDKGICKCGLFQNVTPLAPNGTSEVKAVKRNG